MSPGFPPPSGAPSLADNRIAEGAGWDRRRLAIEIPELTELLNLEQLNISILGFEPIEIEQIRLEPEAPARMSREVARSREGDGQPRRRLVESRHS